MNESTRNVTVTDLGPVPTTPEQFENRGFTLRTHQMFSIHTTPEKFENTTIIGHFAFVIENSAFKIFSVHTKTQSRRFQNPSV